MNGVVHGWVPITMNLSLVSVWYRYLYDEVQSYYGTNTRHITCKYAWYRSHTDTSIGIEIGMNLSLVSVSVSVWRYRWNANNYNRQQDLVFSVKLQFWILLVEGNKVNSLFIWLGEEKNFGSEKTWPRFFFNPNSFLVQKKFEYKKFWVRKNLGVKKNF